ncbi:MAG: hypothetical protein AB7O39_17110 [Flavobacteriaceae bacterium]
MSIAILGSTAHAGPVSDFESQFRQMYGSYRAALFRTNSGQKDASVAAMEDLTRKWEAIAGIYGAAPPPQYADDPEWTATVEAIEAEIGKAKEEIAAGKLSEAHETLEAVRDEVGRLHERNNVETFSDRMNAYHAHMEHVLDMAAGGDMKALLENAAVLSYLAGDVLAVPPAEAAGSAEYAQLADDFRRSVDSFVAAARAGEPGAVKAAIDGLKVPYSKFFLKFG